MNSAIRTTLLMALIAAVAISAAAYYYPWPVAQEQHALVNQNLFDDYSTDAVREIVIEEFDSQTETVRRFSLRQQQGQWRIVEMADFPAGNIARIAAVTSSLLERNVFEVASEDQQDHSLYGVADPASDDAGRGTLLALRDRNQQPLASLIIGESPEGRGEKRFVRSPGQPQVYVIDFDLRILSTEFPDWVDTNLMRLPRAGSAAELLSRIAGATSYIEIDKYLIDAEQLNDNYQKQPIHRVRLIPSETGWVADIWTPTSEGDLPDEPSMRQVAINPGGWLLHLHSSLTNTRFVNVRLKQDRIASHLAQGEASARPVEFTPMINSGFRHTGFANGQHQFDALGGRLTVVRSDGVRQVMYFGALPDAGGWGAGQIVRYVMLTAEVDEAFFPEPEPVDEQDADAYRDYLAQVRVREEQLEAASSAASDFNQRHARWYYIIREDDFSIFSPPLDVLREQIGR